MSNQNVPRALQVKPREEFSLNGIGAGDSRADEFRITIDGVSELAIVTL